MTTLTEHLAKINTITELGTVCENMKVKYSFFFGRTVSVKNYLGSVEFDFFCNRMFDIIEKNLNFNENERRIGQLIGERFKCLNIERYGFGNKAWNFADIEVVFKTYSKEQWEKKFHGFPLPAPKQTVSCLHGHAKRYSTDQQLVVYTSYL